MRSLFSCQAAQFSSLLGVCAVVLGLQSQSVPVLLVTGYWLWRASGLRGAGTRAAEDEIDLALRDLDGALPAPPTDPRLLSAPLCCSS